MKKVLLPIFYLPPVSFSVFLNEENEVTFEQFENFPKQTYRNRAAIYGANGKLPLIILSDIQANGKSKTSGFLLQKIGKNCIGSPSKQLIRVRLILSFMKISSKTFMQNRCLHCKISISTR
jgi:hypothetical protein